MLPIFILALFISSPSFAKNETVDDFDYYILSLSWTPSWCADKGDKRKSPQCNNGREFGFTLHGLWPQYEQGWPKFCKTSYAPPSRSQTKNISDIMGSSGLAWHQWRKHGVCSNLSSDKYFNLSRKAYEKINRPEVFRKIKYEIKLKTNIVKKAFLESNPELKHTDITIICKDSYLQEIRICLTKALKFRSCPQVKSRCTSQIRMSPIR